MDRLVVLVPAWNSQYFPAHNSLLNLLTMNPLNSQFHSVIFFYSFRHRPPSASAQLC